MKRVFSSNTSNIRGANYKRNTKNKTQENKHNKATKKAPTRTLDLKPNNDGVVQTKCFHGGFHIWRLDNASTIVATTIVVRHLVMEEIGKCTKS